ncbi:TetR/AcrR family transcriptional regulator C-terminal domain-containing protein [Streptomyces tendae]|uniref:TetR/AcrR family transcriptional regulator C-terminal domain-containing protein n=1 Tax=Streptomyces tendae TaxID=1932 RepID=UPI0033CF523D
MHRRWHGLERAAHRGWELYHSHPWILPRVMVATRPFSARLSPRTAKNAFASFHGLDLEPADAFRYMFMFASYVKGVALILVGNAEAERQSKATAQGAQAQAGSQSPLCEPGAYPRLARAMRAGAHPWDLDALFASGLAGVLYGIVADIALRHTGT